MMIHCELLLSGEVNIGASADTVNVALVFPTQTNNVVTTAFRSINNLTHSAILIQLLLTAYKFDAGPPATLKLYCGGMVCVTGYQPFGFPPKSVTIDPTQAQTLDVQAWWNAGGGPTLIMSQSLIEY